MLPIDTQLTADELAVSGILLFFVAMATLSLLERCIDYFDIR